MSLIAVVILNGGLVLGALGLLVYVCRVPYRLDRHAKPAPVESTHPATGDRLAA